MPESGAHERTPLLPSAVGSGRHASRSSPSPSIDYYARELQTRLASDAQNQSAGNADIRLAIDTHQATATLTVLLATIELVRQDVHGAGRHVSDDSVIQRLAQDQHRASLVHRLTIEIGKELDSADFGDDDLTEMLWRRWVISEGIAMSALDMMCTGHKLLSVHLSHPLVHRYLKHLWEYGTPQLQHLSARDPLRMSQLESAITPKRLHYLNLVSFLVLWALTVFIAIYPPRLIRPVAGVAGDHHGFTARELTSIIWAIGAAYQNCIPSTGSGSTPLRVSLYLPTLLAVALAPFGNSWAYAAVLCSIPLLTIALVSPVSPSIPYLHLSLLPTSTRLFDRLRNSLKAWILVWPLALAVFVIFSISMNGDLDRGGLQLSNESPPSEPEVAPFEARVVLFGTLVALLAFAMMVACSNSAPETDESDTLGSRENEHRAQVARLSRKHWIKTCRRLLCDTGHRISRAPPAPDEEEGGNDAAIGQKSAYVRLSGPLLPIPINLLYLPLDLVITLGSYVPFARVGARALDRLRYALSVMLAGILCLPFAALDKATSLL